MSRSEPPSAKSLPHAASAPQTIADVLDQMTADHVIEIADRAASLWRSVAEAAWRGDIGVMRLHCRQISTVTREAFASVRELGTAPDEGGVQ
jgi:hypothetical protein